MNIPFKALENFQERVEALWGFCEEPGKGPSGDMGFRVTNLESVMERLPAAGVTFPHGIEAYGVASGRGRLARFRDPTGNRLELVEPASADLNDTSGDRL